MCPWKFVRSHGALEWKPLHFCADELDFYYRVSRNKLLLSLAIKELNDLLMKNRSAPGWKCEFFVVSIIYTSFNLYRLGITFDDTPTLKNLLNLLRAQLPGNYLCKCLNCPTRRAQVTNTRFEFLFGNLELAMRRWSTTAADKFYAQQRQTCLAETWSSRDRCGVGHIRIFTLHGYQTRSFVDPQKQDPNLLRCAFAVIKSKTKKRNWKWRRNQTVWRRFVLED